MPVQARSVILLFKVPLLTFQRLGLDKPPIHRTKIEFFFMASLHKFFLQFIHSHTFRSSLSSANQLPEVIPVQFSSARVCMIRKEPDHGTFQRSKTSIFMYLELSPEIPRASRCLSKQLKSPMFQSLYEQLRSKIPRWISARQNTQDPVLSSLTANYV